MAGVYRGNALDRQTVVQVVIHCDNGRGAVGQEQNAGVGQAKQGEFRPGHGDFPGFVQFFHPVDKFAKFFHPARYQLLVA